METFIFKVLGLIYLPIIIGMFVNKKHYKSMLLEYSKSAVALFFGGILSLVFGLALISLRSYLASPNGIIIIFLGYAAIIEGVVLFVAPDFYKFLTQTIASNEKYYKLCCILGLLFGLIFLTLGYLI